MTRLAHIFLAVSLPLLLARTAYPMADQDPPGAVIAAKIRASYLGSAMACYQRGRKENQDLAGRLDLELTVSAHGRVIRASVVRSDLGPTVSRCLEAAARGWAFARRRGGLAVSVSYPFVFRSASR